VSAAEAGGEPQSGGTLVVAGGQDVVFMDPATSYSAADYEFQRMTLRGIEVTLGQEPEAVFQQIIAGTVDMQWGEITVPTQEIPALLAAGDERLVIEGAGAINRTS